MAKDGQDNYSEILERSWDDIPEPKLLPEGSWLLRGRNAAYLPKKDALNARALFFYTAKEPMSDVDQGELDALGEGFDYEASADDIVKTFWIEKDTDWKAVKEHLALHGIEVKGKSQQETLKAFKGTEIVSFLTQKTINTKNGAKTVNDPTTFAKVE